ncbi:VWA domain-containing protein [Mycoplasmatota bacterium]|nr:VWA domain-containing protein [Mycoplasmatota bacterium]
MKEVEVIKEVEVAGETIYVEVPSPTTSDSVVSNEKYSEISESPFMATKSMSVSTFSVDVDTASYSNMRRYLMDGKLPPVDAIRTEELVNYFRYDYDDPTEDSPISISTEVSECPWLNEHLCLMVGLKTKSIDFSQSPANNLVFLLDVSGSMNNELKLPLVKKSLKMLIDELREEDRISIVVYAGAAGLVLDGASGNDKEEIINAIDNLQAGGSTAGGAGIELAYLTAEKLFIEDGNNRVILATDGDFNVGPKSVSELEDMIAEKRTTGVYLSVLGFGTGNTRDDVMETLADKGNGNYSYIDSLLEAKKVLVEEMGSTLITVAEDVKLQLEFNPNMIKGYRLIGYENRLLSYDDFDNDFVDAGDIGYGHQVTAFYELITASSDETMSEVETSEDIDVNDLKYHIITEQNENDLFTLDIRYKDPTAHSSEELTYSMIFDEITDTPSQDYLFASSVIEFSMLLRDSVHRGHSSFDSVTERASANLGEDSGEYRSQFVDLVEIAKSLYSND